MMDTAKVAKFILQNGPVYDKIKEDISTVTSDHLFEKISHKTRDLIENEIKAILELYIEQQLINNYRLNISLDTMKVDLNIF